MGAIVPIVLGLPGGVMGPPNPSQQPSPTLYSSPGSISGIGNLSQQKYPDGWHATWLGKVKQSHWNASLVTLAQDAPWIGDKSLAEYRLIAKNLIREHLGPCAFLSWSWRQKEAYSGGSLHFLLEHPVRLPFLPPCFELTSDVTSRFGHFVLWLTSQINSSTLST